MSAVRDHRLGGQAGEGSYHPMNSVIEFCRKIGAVIKAFCGKIRTFIGEVGTEFRKTSWPERRELVESTFVVITFIVLLSVVVLACDKFIQKVLTLIRA